MAVFGEDDGGQLGTVRAGNSGRRPGTVRDGGNFWGGNE